MYYIIYIIICACKCNFWRMTTHQPSPVGGTSCARSGGTKRRPARCGTGCGTCCGASGKLTAMISRSSSSSFLSWHGHFGTDKVRTSSPRFGTGGTGVGFCVCVCSLKEPTFRYSRSCSQQGHQAASVGKPQKYIQHDIDNASSKYVLPTHSSPASSTYLARPARANANQAHYPCFWTRLRSLRSPLRVAACAHLKR